MMDPGGHNGDLLDPMSMADAALFADVPDIAETLGVDKLDDLGAVVTTGVDPKVFEDLQRESDQKTASIESLKNEKIQLQVRVDTYDDEITDLREQFNKLQNLTESQNRKLAEFEKVNAEYASKISNLEESSRSQEKTEEMELRMKNKTEEISKLENKIKQMETDSAALTKRNQDFIGDKNKKISELNETIANMKSILQKAEDQVSSSEGKLKELESSIAEKDAENQKLAKTVTDLEQSNDQIALKEKEIAEKHKEIAEKEKEIAEKETEIADLKSKMGEINSEKTSLSEEKSKIETDNKLLSEQASKASQAIEANETLTKDVDSLKKEIDCLHKSIEDMQKIKTTQEEKISYLDKDNESLATKLETTEEKLDENSKKLEAAVKAQTELSVERDDLAGKLSSAEQSKGLQLTLIQTQLSESQEREARLKHELSTVNTRVVAAEKDKQSLASELTKAVTASKMFEDQLKKTSLELETTKKHKLSLEQAAGNYSKLSHEKATVDQRLLDVQKRCSEFERQAGQAKVMEQQMRQVNASNVQMSTDIQNHRSEINYLKQHNDTLARECNNFKNQFEQNNKYMRDYSIQNGELQKKNSELTTMVKAHEAESLRLKSQIDSMSRQASQQADYGSLKSHIDSLTKVLAETKQESITFRKDVDAKNKEISKQKTEIDKLNREVNKAREELDKVEEEESPKVKKRPEDPDRLTLTREVQSVKKDLEAARRANVKLEKELAEKERALARELSKSGGNQGKEDKRKNSDVRNTSELEKNIRKLTDENRRLTADLNDEKAKVLALADMREEDEGLDLSEPPTPKKSRRFSSKRKGKPPTSPGDLEDSSPAKSPAKKKAPRTPKAKSTPASKPTADMTEISSVSKRGRQSKKVAYEEIDISPVEQEEEEEEEMVEEEMPPLIHPKKGKGKNNKSVKNSKKADPEKEPEVAAELPPAITTKGKAKGSKKTAVSIVEPKDEIPLPEPQPKVKGKKKKESKVGAEIIADPSPLPPPSKASKGKRVKIMEEKTVPDVQPKLNKKSQKKSQPPPPPPVAQNKKGGIKRKASDSSENVKPPAAKKGRKR